ncbi:MAG: DUF1566 domain-containing protein [Deltaproteobacteria bacterium]|nr:DUF1566 domain-containing protein [Deltaproteobacteria bacterium]
MPLAVLPTDQVSASCSPWPEPRFSVLGEAARDGLTGLWWPVDAGYCEWPLSFFEALSFVAQMNRENALGHSDWRLPNRREFFSLISHAAVNPSLPPGHPFENVFPGYYWTSSTVARLPDQAWYVHLGGARVFKGMKHASCMVWPVRGQSAAYPATGQDLCFGPDHKPRDCAGTGQDGETKSGAPWPTPRFADHGPVVEDRLTGLFWTRNADLARGRTTWEEAKALAGGLHLQVNGRPGAWRLPTVREAESLVDLSAHSPALPAGHPYDSVGDFYWTATPSAYDTDYAWALYAKDGVVGVGYKTRPEFSAWAVCSGADA